MIDLLEILALLLAAITLSLGLAHALELPGKMRLDRDHYLSTQTIYYPGFTIGGIAEPLVIVAVAALLLTAPVASARFWLLCTALAAFAAVQAIFWTLTQPVNRFWLRSHPLSGAGRRFFEVGAKPGDKADWAEMRDRWERSHLLRATMASIGFLLLAIAVAI